MLDFYLQGLLLKNYYTYTNKSNHFQLFDIDTTLIPGYQYNNQNLEYYKPYTDKIHNYFKTHDNCFTLISGSIPGHLLAILVHKNAEGIQIYIIDSNNAPSDDAPYLKYGLEIHLKKKKTSWN